VTLKTSRISSAEFRGIWEPKLPGTLWATLGLLRDSFTFYMLLLILGQDLVSGITVLSSEQNQ